MTLFDTPLTLESLLARIEALEAKLMDKPARQCADVPPELRQAWGMWRLHKASDKRWTAIAKQRQIAKLAEVSGLDSDLAVRIVGEAIERGWTTFYAPKETPALPAAPKVIGAKAAFKPSETPLERDMAWLRQRFNRGDFGDDRAAYQAECQAVADKHRSAH